MQWCYTEYNNLQSLKIGLRHWQYLDTWSPATDILCILSKNGSIRASITIDILR